MGKFDEDYFYNRKKSNYKNYEKIDPYTKFGSVIAFIEKQNLTGHFLDVGCAFGFLIECIAHRFEEVCGCDISPFAIQKARERNPEADLRVVDIDENLPYPDESFDCITALDILEHTDSFEENLLKLASKLKWGGHLIMSTPVQAWPRKFFGFLDKDETHISIPSEERLKQAIQNSDLIIIKESKFADVPFLKRVSRIPAQIELILKKN
ncbi:MAG: class I SAM-dependent methyltransferase [Candidatus Bathyarchaeota archaeon]|nr:MAG: class I SAM-dependent methyltransferase [Candidatus Bathyarchaeota archaeon]